MRRSLIIRRSVRMVAVLGLTMASGCTSMKVTGTARTGTEQLLLTGTWDAALSAVDFRPLAGRKVFLDPQYISVVDKDWVISSIRRNMAEQGVLLESNKDKAQVIVEAAFGAYGTDQRNLTTGLPAVGVAPSLTGASVVSSGSSTSLTFSQTNQQDAVVKAAMFAYEAKTGQIVWETGPMFNAQGLRDHFFLGSGPYRLSSRPEVEQYPGEAQGRARKRLFHRMMGD
jgi:hypothetical protein